MFGGHKAFLWSHWYPWFGLLLTSPWGFKARGGSLILTWQRCICYKFPEIHLWCDTCRPLDSQHVSWAILFHIPGSKHWSSSKPKSLNWPQFMNHNFGKFSELIYWISISFRENSNDSVTYYRLMSTGYWLGTMGVSSRHWLVLNLRCWVALA